MSQSCLMTEPLPGGLGPSTAQTLCGFTASWFLVLFFAALFGARTLSTAAPFLPPNSTLVMLSGLPGDLESEAQFNEQLQSCLAATFQNTNVVRAFVLCHNPNSLTLPADDRLILDKADRQHVLALAGKLNAGTNPIAVIVFGHGGRQSSTNVFHVRGPRLTPDDFASLASSFGASFSSWVLYFRGSSAFANRLAGPTRQIISSEADSSFGSDPIGLALFLKALRDHPQASFESLGKDLGAATADWYEERNLARVEEPTLWLPDQKPHLLVQGRKNTLTSIQKDDSPPTPNPANTSAAKSIELPGAFNDLRRVAASDYPDDDAIVVRRTLTYLIAANPALSTEHEEFIQILTPEGKRHADFDISYSPPAEDIRFDDCEVLLPNGKLERLDPEAIRETRDKDPGDYQAARHKFFSLPGVAPDAILHIRYRTSWKEFPQPYISLQVPLAAELPIVSSIVKVSVPREASFHWGLENIDAADPSIERGEYGVAYSWKFSKQPAEFHEPLAPPNQAPRLMVSLFPDWRAFADWYMRISQLADKITPEIEGKAAELTHDMKDDREKLVAIYNFVTSLRYVAVPLGVNSFRPHAAANVLNNHYGDCKDKANLFNALLRSLDIPADLVLVPRFRQAYENIPGFAFNHAISRVTLAGENIWVDTTDDVCRFGVLPPGDSGRNVLVIAPGSNQLAHLSPTRAQDHQLKLHAEINCTNLQEGAPAAFSAVALGFPDYELRAAAREIKTRHASVPLLHASFQTAAGSFALESQSFSSVAKLDENFTWRAEGRCVGICSSAGGQNLIHAPMWLPRDWEMALHQRRSPLYLNQGYPLALEEELDFALPRNIQPVHLPPVLQNDEAPLIWRVTWTQPSKDKLRCEFHSELTSAELSLDQTRSFQQQVRKLLTALQNSPSFAPN